MSLHVLQLGPYPPPEGGITRNMIAIREALVARGDRCSVIATSQSARVVDESGVYHPRSPLQLLSRLRSIGYDVAHIHIGGDVTTRVLLLALAVSIFAGRRSVLTMHSGGYATDDHGKGWFARMIFTRFDRIVAVNAALADVFHGLGVDEDRISVIAPYALKRPDPPVTLPEEIDAFFGRHSPVFVSVGGFEPEYEPSVQIAAMKKVKTDHPNAGLIIIGDGSQRFDAEVSVAASGCSDSIMLVGNIDHPIALHVMDRADAVLRITRFDGDAISVREALFLGTPVIATDNGARPAGVHLIDEATEPKIADAILRVLKQEKKDLASADDGAVNVRAVLDLYDDLAARATEHTLESIANKGVRADV